MLVETYEVLEQGADDDGVVGGECDAEALELIERLGLDGQRALNAPREAGDPIVRFPYREITNIEKPVYAVLCPKRDAIKAYRGGAIPLRVLQVAAHAEGMFDEIVVWSAESVVVKDPVLIGIKKRTGEDAWRGNVEYILARWGDVLEPIETLIVKAAKIIRRRKITAAARIKREAESFLARVESIDDEEILRGDIPNAYNL